MITFGGGKGMCGSGECNFRYHLLEGYATCPVHLSSLLIGQEVETLVQSWMCGDDRSEPLTSGCEWLSSLSHCALGSFCYSSLNYTLTNAVMMIVFYTLLASYCQYWWGVPKFIGEIGQ